MTNTEKIALLYEKLSVIEAYSRSMGKLHFDLECCAPPQGMAQAGADMAILGKQVFALQHDPQYEALIDELHRDGEGLTLPQKKLVDRLYERKARTKNYSPEFAYERDQVFNQAYGQWLAAKRAKDYGLYKDTLRTLIDYTRKGIDLRDEKKATYYDTCLDDHEKDGNIAQLDAFFGALKTRIVPLMRRIAREGKPIRTDFMSRPCPIYQQEAFSRYLLEKEGLRRDALVLMTTEHPFTTNFGPKDVRVTTHYYEDHFVSNIFTTLHEGGHALFMQNEPQELYDAHAANGMSNAMHECISRFYENIVGRSAAFIHFLYPKLQQITGGTFADITEQELYEAVNVAEPGLVRMKADELTYCLHIMIRYELEKAFINGEISVEEIPALWKAKYQEYLGVEVPEDDDELGCLQDMHWTGMFGYFPSYALGNAYGAQILNRMQQDFDVDAAIREGALDKILDWFREHVFATASLMTPDEWIRHITGEGLNVNYYLDYLEKKFSEIYQLS